MSETIIINYEDLKAMAETINITDLKNTIDKIETVERRKDEAAEDVKEVYAEAKSKGYCTKTLKQVVKLRKKDKDALQEEDALLELYRGALEI